MYSKLKDLNLEDKSTEDKSTKEEKSLFTKMKNIDKKEEPITQYLKYIIEQTSKNKRIKTLSPDNKTYSDFILPDVKCFSNPSFDRPFLLDDASAYIDFLKIATPITKKYKTPEKIFPEIIQDLDHFINDYFGYGRSELERNILNSNLDDSHSISTYAGKNIASSFERSALTHNLLKLIGLKSTLVMTDFSAYNLIFLDNSAVLYDPTNYSTFELNGVKHAFLSLSGNTKEEIEQFIAGEKELRLNKNMIQTSWPEAKNVYVPDIAYKSPKTKTVQEENKIPNSNTNDYYTDLEEMSLSF